jgi:saccharopine dehydrogenase-like NADP-dependent oxidoreductase
LITPCSIVANDLAGRFDSLGSVRLRVGALPKFPSNALNYNLTWSTDGVINEYCEPCAVLDLLAEGRIAQSGFVRQEDIGLDTFLANCFGRNFAVSRAVREAA